MSKIRSIFTQAQDFVADIRSRNKLYQDLIFEVIEQTLNDNKEPPKEAVVLKTFPQNSTGADLKDGAEQYQSAILRVDRLHDSLPDPSRIYKTATIGETNKCIAAHLLCFSIEPFDSAESSQNSSVILKPGDIVPIEFIDGIIRFGPPKGKHPDYIGFNPSEAREDQGKKADLTLNSKFSASRPNTLAGQEGLAISEESLEAAASNPLLAGQVIKNGRLPEKALKTIEGIKDTGKRPVKVLAEVADEFELLLKDFKAHFGVDLPITDSYRDYDRQVETKANKEKQNKGHEAAKPGTSRHGWGLAFDFNTSGQFFDSPYYKWLFINAPKRGFWNPAWAQKGGKNPEAWHFEVIDAKKYISIFGDAVKQTTEAD
mgnify:CR=1 FL=1